MKKVLLIILLLFPSMVVNADVVTPWIEPYDLVITNPIVGAVILSVVAITTIVLINKKKKNKEKENNKK